MYQPPTARASGKRRPVSCLRRRPPRTAPA